MKGFGVAALPFTPAYRAGHEMEGSYVLPRPSPPLGGKMELKPIGDRLVVLPVRTKSKIGKIYIPEDARRNQKFGKVLAIGDEIHEIKVGDVVLFDSHAGYIYNPKENKLLLKGEDIIATVELEDNEEEKDVS